MKRVAFIMVTFLIFPHLISAQEIDIEGMLGESWYGLYLNGQKAGYSVSSTEKDDQGLIVLTEDAYFQINMAGIRQDMQIYTQRSYTPEGALNTILSRVKEISGVSEFIGKINGDSLELTTITGGQSKTTILPKPNESLHDAIGAAEWIQNNPPIGDTFTSYVFEPLYQREISAISEIMAQEERILEGSPTKVYKVKTSMDLMGIDSIAVIAEDGTTLEDVIAGMITRRLEPKEVAKDVDYNNDVIISNAALVDTPIPNPRSRDKLRLVLSGPLTEDHFFNDERQYIAKNNGAIEFVAKRVSLDNFTPAQVPVEDETALKWIEPTTLVQSDHEKLIAKTQDIIGDETDTLIISNKICAWVNENMKSTFSARLTNALEVLDSLEGDCTEHSILYIGLARAAGLPAREVAGVVYVEGTKPGFYFHQWATVWVGKWIDVDPTFNQPLADVTHIKLAEGDLLRQARLIPVVGHLKIEVPEQEGM